MIKAPITKQGDIRYFELIKITVLISFIYAFFSFITDSHFYLTLQSSMFISNAINVFVFISFMVAAIMDLLDLMKYVKSFIIEFLYIPVIELSEIVIGYTTSLCLDIRNNLFITLRVIRC